MAGSAWPGMADRRPNHTNAYPVRFCAAIGGFQQREFVGGAGGLSGKTRCVKEFGSGREDGIRDRKILLFRIMAPILPHTRTAKANGLRKFATVVGTRRRVQIGFLVKVRVAKSVGRA